MQKLILLLLVTIITNCVVAQDCSDLLCQQILNLRIANQSKNNELNAKSFRIQELTKQYQEAVRLRDKDKGKLSGLIQRISQLNEERKKVQEEKSELEYKYKEAIELLKQQKDLNEAQKKMIETYEKENKKLKASNWELENKNENLKKEIEEIGYENSYFFNVELGHKKNEAIIFTKIFKGGEEKYINNGFLGKELNVLKISGQTYIPITSESNKGRLKGKLFIYSNNELVETIEYEFQEMGNKRFFNHYEVNSQLFNLEKSFPEKTNLKIAFTDEDTYEKNYPEVFNNFWVAQNQGLFNLTSLKPQSKTDVLTIDDILESSVIVGNAITTDKLQLRVQLSDNGEIDGDRASFFVNNIKVIDNLLLNGNIYKQNITLKKGVNKFTLLALNNGSEPPCTVIVQIFDDEVFVDQIILRAEEGSAASLQVISQ